MKGAGRAIALPRRREPAECITGPRNATAWPVASRAASSFEAEAADQDERLGLRARAEIEAARALPGVELRGQRCEGLQIVRQTT